MKQSKTMSGMKTIQLQGGISDDDDNILRAAGVKRITPGWYTVGYNGVVLDRSTVAWAKRNVGGEIDDK